MRPFRPGRVRASSSSATTAPLARMARSSPPTIRSQTRGPPAPRTSDTVVRDRRRPCGPGRRCSSGSTSPLWLTASAGSTSSATTPGPIPGTHCETTLGPRSPTSRCAAKRSWPGRWRRPVACAVGTPRGGSCGSIPGTKWSAGLPAPRRLSRPPQEVRRSLGPGRRTPAVGRWWSEELPSVSAPSAPGAGTRSSGPVRAIPVGRAVGRGRRLGSLVGGDPDRPIAHRRRRRGGLGGRFATADVDRTKPDRLGHKRVQHLRGLCGRRPLSGRSRLHADEVGVGSATTAGLDGRQHREVADAEALGARVLQCLSHRFGRRSARWFDR